MLRWTCPKSPRVGEEVRHGALTSVSQAAEAEIQLLKSSEELKVVDSRKQVAIDVLLLLGAVLVF